MSAGTLPELTLGLSFQACSGFETVPSKCRIALVAGRP